MRGPTSTMTCPAITTRTATGTTPTTWRTPCRAVRREGPTALVDLRTLAAGRTTSWASTRRQRRAGRSACRSPYGDHAGLDADRIGIHQLGTRRPTPDQHSTLVFGHHPVTDTGASDDTWLFYGHQEFISALDDNRASTYNYGHTHDYSQALFTGNAYTGSMANGGIHYYNVKSLGKDSGSYYSVVAIDCNGLSSMTPSSGAWPVVLITAPVDKYIGGAVNPYAYTVPASSANFVRALVFDTAASPQVSYRIDGGTTWYPMTRVASGSPVWQGPWNASGLAPGDHTIEVRAVSATTVSDSIKVEVTSAAPNRAPCGQRRELYDGRTDTALNVGAPGVLANDSDPDGERITAVLNDRGPSHGTLVHAESPTAASPTRREPATAAPTASLTRSPMDPCSRRRHRLDHRQAFADGRHGHDHRPPRGRGGRRRCWWRPRAARSRTRR